MEYFENHGFSVIRSAGSGHHRSPDILVFKMGKQFGFEAKVLNKDTLSIKKEQYENLLKWYMNTGIDIYIVWKKGKNEEVFIPLKIFKKNNKTYSITYDKALQNGLRKYDLVFG